MSDVQYLSRGNMEFTRRLYVKRLLLATGLYESEWVDITRWVVDESGFPTVKRSMGDTIALSNYLVHSTQVTLSSINREFGDGSDPLSLFSSSSGFLSRYKAKFKLTISYVDDDYVDVPVLNSYYLMSGEPKTNFNNTVTLPVRDMLFALQTESASGLSLSGTVDNMITQLLQATDSRGNRLFDRFCEGANDGERYVVPSGVVTVDAFTVSDQETVYDTISKLCLYFDGYIFFNDDGNFQVKVNRDESATSKWTFNVYSADNDYGVNAATIDKTDGVSKVYNTAVITYGDALDSTVTSTTFFTVGDGSTRDIHGQKIFTGAYKEVTTESVAQEIADRIVTNRSEPKGQYLLTTKPVFLQVSDKVTINSKGPLILGSEDSPFIIGVSEIGGTDVIADRAGAISVSGVACKVIEFDFNPNNLSFKYLLEEV